MKYYIGKDKSVPALKVLFEEQVVDLKEELLAHWEELEVKLPKKPKKGINGELSGK